MQYYIIKGMATHVAIINSRLEEIGCEGLAAPVEAAGELVVLDELMAAPVEAAGELVVLDELMEFDAVEPLDVVAAADDEVAGPLAPPEEVAVDEAVCAAAEATLLEAVVLELEAAGGALLDEPDTPVFNAGAAGTALAPEVAGTEPETSLCAPTDGLDTADMTLLPEQKSSHCWKSGCIVSL